MQNIVKSVKIELILQILIYIIMAFDNFWNNPEISQTEKQDISDINTTQISKQSEEILKIRELEYADNVDNKVTIPSDLEDYFPYDKITEKENNKTEKIEQFKK